MSAILRQNLYFFGGLPAFLVTAILSFTAVVNAQEINPAQMKRGAIIITAVEGKAVIIKPGATESKNAAKGQALQQGEKIITDKKSTVSLAFENGSVIQVEAESNFVVEEFLQAPWEVSEQALSEMKTEPSNSKLSTYLEYGDVTSGVKKLKPGSSLNVSTPLGTAGIRGTEFKVGLQRDAKGGSKGLSVAVASGEVAVSTKGGATASVKGGFSTSVTVTPGANGQGSSVSQPVTTQIPAESSLSILQSVKSQQESAATVVTNAMLQSSAAPGSGLNTNQKTAIEDAAEIGGETLLKTVEQLSAEKASSAPEIAAFATDLAPDAAPDIAAAAATGAPSFAPQIAGAVTSMAPAFAAQIATSVSTAVPTAAASVAAVVATAVPSQAPQIAASVATAFPDAAAAIARSVAQAQPQQAEQIILNTSEAAPEAAAAIASEVQAEVEAQAQGEGTGVAGQATKVEPPPAIPTNPVQPPPPRPTPTPVQTPTLPPPNPSPTKSPNPTPTEPWTLQDFFNALNEASDQEILNSLKLQPEQLSAAKDLIQKITLEQFENWTRNYFDQNHSEFDLDAAFEDLNINSLSDFGKLFDDIKLDRESFLQFLEANANPPPPPPTPTPTPTPNPSNA